MDPRTTIAAFDAFLAARGPQAELIEVGGAALALLGLVVRILGRRSGHGL